MIRVRLLAVHPALGRILRTCLLSCCVAGCQAGAQHKTLNTAVMDEIQDVMTESIASTSAQAYPDGPPLDVLQALVPGLSLEAVDMEPEEERFDFAVREPLDLKEFFSLLFEGTNYSVIVHPELSGSISAMDLKNVTVSEAMKQLSAIYGFSIQRDGSIYRVEPGGLQTRIFKINYLNVQRDGTSNMSVTGGTGLGSSGGGGAGGLGGLQGGINGLNNASLLNNQSALLNNGLGGTAGGSGGNSGGATVNTRSQSDYWQDLEEIITSIIGTAGSGEGGGLLDALNGQANRAGNQRAVIISPQTGMVVVRAYPAELEKVAEFLELSQAALQRQVVLEAKILEVELKEGFQSGIDLSVLGKVNTNNDITAEFEFLEGSVSSISSPLSLTYGSTDFNGVIKLLETQGNVQVISSPRITTLNNQKAVFKVGDEEYFMTNANSTSFGAGDQQTTNQNTNLQPFFSGIALDVTPQISDSGDIILHIHPLLNQVQEDIKLVNGRELPLANSATRESDSIARARNGEVVVISGLMQTRAKGTEAGIPGARNIPVVGKALEQRTTEVVKTELVILLRAIVDEGSNMQQLIQEHDEGFDALRKRIDPYYR